MAVDKNNVEEKFYKIVLGWDYYLLLQESSKNVEASRGNSALKAVKNKYTDVEDYISTFEPLLFEEVKAQIFQRMEEEEVTGWIQECSEFNGFYFSTVICTDTESLSQNDLLLVSKEPWLERKSLSNMKVSPKEEKNMKFEDDNDLVYGFALLEHCQQYKIRLRMNLSGEVALFNTAEVQSDSRRLSNMRSLITKAQSKLYIKKICSLSTIVREYVGLLSIRLLPFKDLILTAGEKKNTTEDRAWEIPKALNDFIESNHNTSQIKAINAGLSGKNFILIQGPPGTGKTQTILGLLSALLHATPSRVPPNQGKLSVVKCGPELPLHDKYNHWEKASSWLVGINHRDALMPVDGDDGFFPTSGNELKPEVVNTFRKYRVRVLVCAPSNSALDEIVLRILNTGIRDENDRAYTPKIVRIGLKAHHSVQAVSMDYLVEQKLSGMDSQSCEKQKQGGASKDKDSIRTSILEESVIVFSTLSFSGSSMFSRLNHGFDVVIIDEAAQAVEPATLIPLANGCKQVILVGDPVQLPATVISEIAKESGYGMSLFSRLQRAGYPVQMLKTQYRMHPEIRIFPSKEFYDEGLEDGPDVVEQTRRGWHDYRCFGPFSFFDITDGEESKPSGSGSWVNVDEVEFVLAMYHKLVSGYPELKSSSRLAIISPYKHQVDLLRDKFRETFGEGYDKVVDINTVDGFQGREKDVAIFSCVRSSKDKGIGFVADFRRMNVGITRARSSVLVVGSASTLRRKDEHWRNLIESAEGRNVLFKVSKPYNNFFSDSNLKSMEVKRTSPERPEPDVEDMEVSVPLAGVVEQMQTEEQDWGDAGDGEGFDEE